MSRKVRRATVISTTAIAPHLKRLVVGSDEFHDFPADQQGAYVKVLLPHAGQDEVEIDLKAAEPAPKRSYTIRGLILLTIQLRLILSSISIVVSQLIGLNKQNLVINSQLQALALKSWGILVSRSI